MASFNHILFTVFCNVSFGSSLLIITITLIKFTNNDQCKCHNNAINVFPIIIQEM